MTPEEILDILGGMSCADEQKVLRGLIDSYRGSTMEYIASSFPVRDLQAMVEEAVEEGGVDLEEVGHSFGMFDRSDLNNEIEMLLEEHGKARVLEAVARAERYKVY